MKKELKKLELKLEKYNMPAVGNMEEEKEEGRYRILYNQMNNASTRVVREIKMGMVERLNERYDVDINLFGKLGNNWTVDGHNNNLGSWYTKNQEKLYYVAACNEVDKVRTPRHQPGGTAVAVRGAMTQYAKAKPRDERKLGRF